MLLTYLSAIILCYVIIHSCCNNVATSSGSIDTNTNKDIIFSDINVQGDIQSATIADYEHQVLIFNPLSISISLYFLVSHSNSVEDVYLQEILPKHSMHMTSYVGHRLYALESESRKLICVKTIVSDVTDYIFDYDPDYQSHTSHDLSALSHPFHLNVEIRKRVHPSVKSLSWREKISTYVATKFRSLSAKPINLWYDDGRNGVPEGYLQMGNETTTNSIEGHVFYATYADDKSKVITRLKVSKNQAIYLINDSEFPASQEILDGTNKELEFIQEYLERTGIQWRHYYSFENGPRPPPSQWMWPATERGQVHQVMSSQGYWFCNGRPLDCQSPSSIQLELEVISTSPRAFVIPNFLSSFEADQIILEGAPSLHSSEVGDLTSGVFSSDVRTSRNSWIERLRSPLIESIYRRAADLMRLEYSYMFNNAEHIQVVRYEKGQKYEPHHDWGIHGSGNSRFITLLLYLNNQTHPNAGGETSFPKGGTDKGLKIHPGKGSAVMFYNLLEDGNADDLSLHSGTAINDGVKWLANFWVWEPFRDD